MPRCSTGPLMGVTRPRPCHGRGTGRPRGAMTSRPTIQSSSTPRGVRARPPECLDGSSRCRCRDSDLTIKRDVDAAVSGVPAFRRWRYLCAGGWAAGTLRFPAVSQSGGGGCPTACGRVASGDAGLSRPQELADWLRSRGRGATARGRHPRRTRALATHKSELTDDIARAPSRVPAEPTPSDGSSVESMARAMIGRGHARVACPRCERRVERPER